MPPPNAVAHDRSSRPGDFEPAPFKCPGDREQPGATFFGHEYVTEAKRPVQVGSRTPDRCGIGVSQTEDHVDRRRLARAVRAEQCDGLAGLDHEVDAANPPGL